jgi:hypothetical protein
VIPFSSLIQNGDIHLVRDARLRALLPTSVGEVVGRIRSVKLLNQARIAFYAATSSFVSDPLAPVRVQAAALRAKSELRRANFVIQFFDRNTASNYKLMLPATTEIRQELERLLRERPVPLPSPRMNHDSFRRCRSRAAEGGARHARAAGRRACGHLALQGCDNHFFWLSLYEMQSPLPDHFPLETDTRRHNAGVAHLWHTVRRDWPRLLLDVVVLILGITISFALEQRRSSAADRKKERYALNAVHDDLVRDTLQLTSDMRTLYTQASHLGALLDSTQVKHLSTDTIAAIFNHDALQFQTFLLTQSAFDQMKATGASTTIRNRALVRRLVGFYSSGMRRLYAWDDIAREHMVDRIQPYVTEHVPFSMGQLARQSGALALNSGSALIGRFVADDYLQLAHSPEFLKLLLRAQYIKMNQRRSYGVAVADMRSLLVDLDRELAGGA